MLLKEECNKSDFLANDVRELLKCKDIIYEIIKWPEIYIMFRSRKELLERKKVLQGKMQAIIFDGENVSKKKRKKVRAKNPELNNGEKWIWISCHDDLDKGKGKSQNNYRFRRLKKEVKEIEEEIGEDYPFSVFEKYSIEDIKKIVSFALMIEVFPDGDMNHERLWELVKYTTSKNALYAQSVLLDIVLTLDFKQYKMRLYNFRKKTRSAKIEGRLNRYIEKSESGRCVADTGRGKEFRDIVLADYYEAEKKIKRNKVRKKKFKDHTPKAKNSALAKEVEIPIQSREEYNRECDELEKEWMPRKRSPKKTDQALEVSDKNKVVKKDPTTAYEEYLREYSEAAKEWGENVSIDKNPVPLDYDFFVDDLLNKNPSKFSELEARAAEEKRRAQEEQAKKEIEWGIKHRVSDRPVNELPYDDMIREYKKEQLKKYCKGKKFVDKLRKRLGD